MITANQNKTETNNEVATLAKLRILGCVVKADGTPNDLELLALQTCVEGIPFAPGTSVQLVLAETPDLDKQLGLVTSRECREQTFQAAFALAHSDGKCSTQQQNVLDRICEVWGISAEQPGILGRLMRGVKDTVLPSNINAVSDAAKRKSGIEGDTLKYAILSGVLGGFPVPGFSIATDVAVVGLQVKLVRDIGQRWGHKVDQKAANAILLGLGLGTGARIAVNTLFKFIPVAGVVWGSSTSFASTWALGEIADKYFESGAKSDIATFRDAFHKAMKEGQSAFKSHQTSVEATGHKFEAALKTMGEELRNDKLSPEEYVKKVAFMTTETPALQAHQAV